MKLNLIIAWIAGALMAAGLTIFTIVMIQIKRILFKILKQIEIDPARAKTVMFNMFKDN